MGKIRWRHRLGSELTAAVLLSLFFGIFLFLGLSSLSNHVLDQWVSSSEYYERQQKAAMSSLKTFLDRNQVRLSDTKALDGWVKKERYVTLLVFKDQKLVYSSYPREDGEDTGINGSGQEQEAESDYGILSESQDNPDTVRFADGTAQVFLFPYYEYLWYRLAAAVEGILSFLLFITLFLWLIRRKTAFIELLKNELLVLEGGDLSCRVTVKGSDELGELAEGIERMRRSIVERDEEEQKIRKANQELVTAMSHDLRTPLTALLGYLELLESGDCEEGQQARFLHTSYKKAVQMKEMSDRLFEYFLVYGSSGEEIDLEEADAMELVAQTVCEEAYGLEGQGFCIDMELQEVSCPLMVNTDLFRRVVDNLFSNLSKYADPAQPIRIFYGKEDGGVVITVENRINKSVGQVESSGIGLKTCSRIMKEHGGWFRTEEHEGTFRASFYLPDAF